MLLLHVISLISHNTSVLSWQTVRHAYLNTRQLLLFLKINSLCCRDAVVTTEIFFCCSLVLLHVSQERLRTPDIRTGTRDISSSGLSEEHCHPGLPLQEVSPHLVGCRCLEAADSRLPVEEAFSESSSLSDFISCDLVMRSWASALWVNSANQAEWLYG